MNLLDRVLAYREGGQTQRCHTMQYMGPYNVAIHSYNALGILLLLHDKTEPSLNLIKAVLWHDVPERWTGDVPAPAKWASPMLKAILDTIESKILDKLGMTEVFDALTKEEQAWLTGVDLLELYIWGKEQVAHGNSAAAQLTERVLVLIAEKKDRIPIEIQTFIVNFTWKRTVECHELT